MVDNTKPAAEEQIKTFSRQARGKAVYRPPEPPAETFTQVPETESVAFPEVGPEDVEMIMAIELRTRKGLIARDRDQAILPGLLDPANRGHMARSVERRFEEMRDLVVQRFNQIIDKNLKASEPKTTPETEVRSRGRFPAGGAVVEVSPPEDDAVAPYPKPPGTFHPPIDPNPPSIKT